MNINKAFLLQTDTGPVIILTRYESLREEALLSLLAERGLTKFEAHELDLGAVRQAYSAHYEHLLTQPGLNDELVALDDDGQKVYRNISFADLGPPIYFEGPERVQFTPGGYISP